MSWARNRWFLAALAVGAVATAASAGDDWPLFRGDAQHSNAAKGTAPASKPRWRVSLLFPWGYRFKDEDLKGMDRRDIAWSKHLTEETNNWVKQRYARSIESRTRAGRICLPVGFPIAAVGRVFLRTPAGICWFYLKADAKQETQPGDLLLMQHDSYGLYDLAEGHGLRRSELDSWLQIPATPRDPLFGQTPPVDRMPEHALNGTLGTDGRRVYALADLAVRPSAEAQLRTSWQRAVVQGNSLRVIDPETGRLEGALGDPDLSSRDTIFRKSFFLGVPLPLDGRLYALNEKGRVVRLVCLNPTAPGFGIRADGLDWQLPLAPVNEALTTDPGRRGRPAFIAAEGDLLVCPTNAGVVAAVNRRSRHVAWLFRYREIVHPADFDASWQTTAPIIAEGKVLLAPLDADDLFCLDLASGRLLWKAPRGDSLFPAAALDGRIVLVGAARCRALSLASGKPLWQTDTGTPGGQGAALGSVYYLPLRSGAKSKKPEFAALDLHTGAIRETIRAPDADAVGNLLFHQGTMLTQSFLTLTVYPQR